MKALTFSEASKRVESFDIIADKLGRGLALVMKNGARLTFHKPSEEVLLKIRRGKKKHYESVRITAREDGRTYRLSQLGKTEEFGGKMSDGTHYERQEVASLKRQLANIKKNTGLAYVDIRVGKMTFRVKDVELTKGTPKGDFHFIGENGKPAFHVSHKNGTGPAGFHQWGGITDKAGREISESREVKSFSKAVREQVGLQMRKGVAFWRRVPARSKLALASIYGPKFNTKKYEDPDCVAVVAQGRITLRKMVGNTNEYKLTAHHIMINPEAVKAPYDTILMATYKSDKRKSGGVLNCRIGIYPKLDRVATEI